MKHILGASTNSVLDKELAEKDIQPNAIDVRADRIFTIGDDLFQLSEEGKTHRSSAELLPHVLTEDWVLEPGAYDIQTDIEVTIGDGEAGRVIPRSTLVRNGCFIVSGLYDTGYSGSLGCVLHVTCGPLKLSRHTRIAQFLLFEAENIKQYDGNYGKESKHDEKYIKTVSGNVDITM